MIKLVNKTQTPISFNADTCKPDKGVIQEGESIEIKATTGPIVRDIVFGNPSGEDSQGEAYNLIKALDVPENAIVTVSVSIQKH